MTQAKHDGSKPVQMAVALKYDLAGEDVPQVVAIGRGHLAEKILTAAADAGVPIDHNAELARSLAALQLDQAIPRDLYKAVAAVIGFLISQQRLRRP